MTKRDEADAVWARSVLGVGPGAGSRTVQRAFRSRCKEVHPDRGGDPVAFEDAHVAHEILRGIESNLAQGWLGSDGRAEEIVPRVAVEKPLRRPRANFQQIFREAMRSEATVGRKAHDGWPPAD